MLEAQEGSIPPAPSESAEASATGSALGSAARGGSSADAPSAESHDRSAVSATLSGNGGGA
jgi:hypothetical protein